MSPQSPTSDKTQHQFIPLTAFLHEVQAHLIYIGDAPQQAQIKDYIAAIQAELAKDNPNHGHINGLLDQIRQVISQAMLNISSAGILYWIEQYLIQSGI